MKQITVYILSIVLFCTLNAPAQFVSVPTKINTPYGSATIPTQVYMPRHYNYGNGVINRKYNYTIVLLNDSTIEVKTKINIDDPVNFLSWGKKDNKTIIRPPDTKEIYRIGADGRKVAGIPMDSCWAFLVDTGKIRTYSITSDIDVPSIAYIQKGENGTILDLTRESMEQMVGDNQRILALVKKNKLLKAIKEYNKGK
jgi:hypothetical protein